MNIDTLHKLFIYDAEAGELYWRERTPDMFNTGKRFSAERKCNHWNGRHANKPAGCLCPDGYIKVRLSTRLYRAHQIIYAMAHGYWPPMDLDHKDGNRSNNTIANLRLATHSQNMANKRVHKSSRHGLKGVEKQSASSGYISRIMVHGKRIYLGAYPTVELAHAAYVEAAKKYFGEFARAA
jgi:hypothetical protein